MLGVHYDQTSHWYRTQKLQVMDSQIHAIGRPIFADLVTYHKQTHTTHTFYIL